MNTISKRNVGYISFLLHSEMPEFCRTLPRQDKTHTNPVVDYSNLILEKKLSILTHSYGQSLIEYINAHNEQAVKEMIFGLEYVPDEPYMILKNK